MGSISTVKSKNVKIFPHQNFTLYGILSLQYYRRLDIPTDFVEALDSPWLRSAHQNSQSESSSEFEADENQLFHEHLVSPDIMDEIDGEDHHQAAHEKRT